MAKFTIELRKLISDSDYQSVMNNYPIFSEEYREELNTKINDELYWEEIGFETPQMFYQRLRSWLNINMQKYNFLYESALLEISPFIQDVTVIEHDGTIISDNTKDITSEYKYEDKSEEDTSENIIYNTQAVKDSTDKIESEDTTTYNTSDKQTGDTKDIFNENNSKEFLDFKDKISETKTYNTTDLNTISQSDTTTYNVTDSESGNINEEENKTSNVADKGSGNTSNTQTLNTQNTTTDNGKNTTIYSTQNENTNNTTTSANGSNSTNNKEANVNTEGSLQYTSDYPQGNISTVSSVSEVSTLSLTIPDVPDPYVEASQAFPLPTSDSKYYSSGEFENIENHSSTQSINSSENTNTETIEGTIKDIKTGSDVIENENVSNLTNTGTVGDVGSNSYNNTVDTTSNNTNTTSKDLTNRKTGTEQKAITGEDKRDKTGQDLSEIEKTIEGKEVTSKTGENTHELNINNTKSGEDKTNKESTNTLNQTESKTGNDIKTNTGKIDKNGTNEKTQNEKTSANSTDVYKTIKTGTFDRTQASQLLEFRKTFINIDKKLIESMRAELFMLVYELY